MLDNGSIEASPGDGATGRARHAVTRDGDSDDRHGQRDALSFTRPLMQPYTTGKCLRFAIGEENSMPLFMDVHDRVEGLTADAVTQAHKADLEHQGKHGADYQRYWFDEATGKVFCLIEAPTKEAAIAVHREAHGLVADSVTEVKEGA
jgi:hypothetical protein